MKNAIPKNPEKVVQYLDNLIVGDDKHQADKPLPKEIRAELVATRDELKSLNGSVQTSKGQYRQFTHDRRESLAAAVGKAERFRAAVISVHGPKDPALVDYALVTRRKPRKAGTAEADVRPETRKAEKARVHLAKMQAALVKAKERMSALEARVARQEAKVASAPVVTPNEPTSVSQPTVTEPTPAPTSESGTK